MGGLLIDFLKAAFRVWELTCVLNSKLYNMSKIIKYLVLKKIIKDLVQK